MDEILHHFETMIETIVAWHSQEIARVSERCEMDLRPSVEHPRSLRPWSARRHAVRSPGSGDELVWIGGDAGTLALTTARGVPRFPLVVICNITLRAFARRVWFGGVGTLTDQ